MDKKKLNEKNIILLILLAGVLVRLLYVIFMPVVEFAQYDIGKVDLENNVLTGHLGYIFWLVKNHSVPDFDPRQVYQFNHPPVHHALCALWISFIGLFTDNTKTLIESAQYVTFIYSVITLFAFSKLIDEALNIGSCREKRSVMPEEEADRPIKEVGQLQRENGNSAWKIKGKIIALIIFAFQPTLIMTAGSLNNDGAGLMFQVLALWFALRWLRTKSYKDIMGIALTIGFGMLSKLSAGLVAVPIGAMLVYVFVKEWAEKKAFPGKRFIQYIAFGAVCFPIGLFWVLRCYIKFGMPFTYIAYLPDTSPQYVGMYSFAERMLLPNPIELIKNLLHGSLGMGWNVWVQLIRTSALGECDLSTFSLSGKLICLGMMGMNFLVAVWALIQFVRVYFLPQSKLGKESTNEGQRTEGAEMSEEMNCSRNIDMVQRIIWILCWIVMMYSYLSFANKYPHECSMNFRYVQLAMVPPMVGLALGMKARRVNEDGVSKKNFTDILTVIILGAYVLFSILTIICWCYVA